MRRILYILLAVFITWGFSVVIRAWRSYDAAQSENIANNWQKYSWETLYTQMHVTLEAPKSRADSLVDSLKILYNRYTMQMEAGSKLDSVIFYANVNDTIALNFHQWKLFRFGEMAFQKSNGLIHPAIGNLLRTWGLLWKQTPHIPNDAEIAKAKSKMGPLFYKTLVDSSGMVVFQSGIHYALGAFDKGYAIDLGADFLEAHNIENFFLEIGGDLRTHGLSPRKSPWNVGIQDPDKDRSLVGTISMNLPGIHSMATSGGYRKFFEDSLGNRYHHILDPRTGKPAIGKKSVTALSKGAMLTDFYATYLFVLSPKEAINLANNTENLECLIIDSNNQILHSSGLNSFVQKKIEF